MPQIRDSLNLTYDVTFDVGVSDMYQVAWWSVHVTSKPENIHKAVNASLDVLRGIATMRIMPYELERAKVTVLTKHDADTKVCFLLDVSWLGPLAGSVVLCDQHFVKKYRLHTQSGCSARCTSSCVCLAADKVVPGTQLVGWVTAASRDDRRTCSALIVDHVKKA